MNHALASKRDRFAAGDHVAVSKLVPSKGGVTAIWRSM